MGNKYEIYLAKFPFKGYWEDMHGFETFDDMVEFAKQSIERGYDIIDMKCRDIKKGATDEVS